MQRYTPPYYTDNSPGPGIHVAGQWSAFWSGRTECSWATIFSVRNTLEFVNYVVKCNILNIVNQSIRKLTSSNLAGSGCVRRANKIAL